MLKPTYSCHPFKTQGFQNAAHGRMVLAGGRHNVIPMSISGRCKRCQGV